MSFLINRTLSQGFLLCVLAFVIAACNPTDSSFETASELDNTTKEVQDITVIEPQAGTRSDDVAEAGEEVASPQIIDPTYTEADEDNELNIIEGLFNSVQALQGDPLILSLSPIATDFYQPVAIASTNDGNGRLFIVDRPGRIYIVEPDGTVLDPPFLDIESRVDTEFESGLLGLAFHPNYYENGYFYVNYVHVGGGGRQTRISRFSVSAQSADMADPGSEEILLTVNQPAANHNAGDIHFGHDGYLYIPLGDGGSNENGQELTTLLGKITRIDVDSNTGSDPDCKGAGSGNYTIPGSNPFVNGAGGTCDEIWASGLRNPWRSSFDRLTGDLYLGDVGEYSREEIDFQAAESTGGENYGWPCYEAHEPFFPSSCQETTDLTYPIFDYGRADGSCSVVGGYVYRGDQYPAMFGRYFLTDFCSGSVWDIAPDDAEGWTVNKYSHLFPGNFVSFGEATNCELYLSNMAEGTVYHLEEGTSIASAGPTSPLCNERPLALADSYPIPEGDVLTVPVPGVLLNDGDINGDGLTAVLITEPEYGNLNLKADGSFTYTPRAEFNGRDQFTYRASDKVHQSRTVVVSIGDSAAQSERQYLPLIITSVGLALLIETQ